MIAGSERALLRRGRCFSATSGATNRQLRRIVGGSARIESVPAGVPDDLFELERAEDDYLLYFGRIDVYHKGIDTVLEAFATIASRFPDVELRIAGRGRDGERVRGLARRLGVEGRIRFLGAVSDGERRRLFGGALAQLMPSRFEGFGMAAAEAMAAGVPVIASSAGSLPEVVDPPRGGIVVPRGDAGALAEGVARLLADPHLRNATSASARRSAERFRWASVARRHLEFLRRVADQSRQTHPQSR